MVIAERRPEADGVRSARILLVEDEAIIRDWIASHLQEEGHRTTPAGSGEEALTLLSWGGACRPC
jgi:CheY-like chemotaxis protein